MPKEQTQLVAGVRVPIDLNANGLERGTRHNKELISEFREERIEAARGVIRLYFDKIKGFNTGRSSYGLKHDIERKLGYHVANGELIVAMIGEGYTFKRDTINCYFNVSETSRKALVADIERAEAARLRTKQEAV